MLSYRHGFHAGNPADVFKHSVLLSLIDAMQSKDKGIRFIDTHAGAARYDLTDPLARKNNEHLQGVARLWEAGALPAPFARYRDAVAMHNPDGRLRWYPGSPTLFLDRLRAQDELVLCELHPAEQAVLTSRFGGQPRVHIHCGDGYRALRRWLPPPTGRALVLIDPPYEGSDELDRMLAALRQALKRCAHCVYAIWYPVIEGKHTRPHAFAQALDLSAEAWLDVAVTFAPGQRLGRMLGCGMALINCPWRARSGLASIAELWPQLTVDGNRDAHPPRELG
ncbi:MAG: 23S rRNA (adenine(2030)-N(6))-methyltransferase RlmJ [Wenzhouxiangellaceae bacterium]